MSIGFAPALHRGSLESRYRSMALEVPGSELKLLALNAKKSLKQRYPGFGGMYCRPGHPRRLCRHRIKDTGTGMKEIRLGPLSMGVRLAFMQMKNRKTYVTTNANMSSPKHLALP